MASVSEKSDWRILNVEPAGYCPEARAILAAMGQLEERVMTRTELLQNLAAYDVLIVRLAHQIDSAIIDAGQRLKAIVSATTGLDHIDVEYAHRQGIKVISLFGEVDFLKTISATAEHTWALLLCLIRRVVPAAAAIGRGEWERDNFRGNELNGKRLGIIGMGRLGTKVAQYGRAFDMDVGAFDPFITRWPEKVRRAATLNELLSSSNVLTLHAPLNDETGNMIGAEELALLPPGAWLINTSRGRLIDEHALTAALDSGHLAGAAVDVIADERTAAKRSRSPLMVYAQNNANLIITPHIAGATVESMARTEIFIVNKLKNVLQR